MRRSSASAATGCEAAGASLIGNFCRALGHRPARSRPRRAAHLRDLPPPGAGRRGASARRVRRHRFSRFQLPARARDAQARRPGRVLHQPAVVGVAPRPDEDDAADCRSGAGDFPVRAADLRAGGRARSNGSDTRCSTSPTRRSPASLFLARLGLDPGRRSSRCCRAAGATRCARSCPTSHSRRVLIRARMPGGAVRRRPRAAP